MLPTDYLERVYAGVLGKIVGVYLGRPFEGWTYEKIIAELGEVSYYVHNKLNKPLVVTDDDISGTFTFLRALPDHGNRPDLTPEEIGRTWLNYLIERKTILWWGGIGNSTEHTAYLRLKHGIPAPRSGSIALNGPIVAEQIGAQIFIDGWAMVAPGDPERAADLARRAASVSHDGEAIYGAQVLAAMESLAFVEHDIDRLIDTGVALIPSGSTIYRMIADLRDWHIRDGDWRKTRQRIVDQYGYKDFIGGCHMVPNHALIHLGLLYGQGDFQKSLMICNTAGWDTDCNSGNLGCLLGIRGGLDTFAGPVDWRGPVADRIYLPTMDGGRCVTDAVQETLSIVNLGRAMAGEEPIAPKAGARFHFELPGSVQAFQVETESTGAASATIANVPGHSRAGWRSLAIRRNAPVSGPCIVRAQTATFILPTDLDMPGYELIASPTLYPGQTLRGGVWADEHNPGPITARLAVAYYDASDQPARLSGPEVILQPGQSEALAWTLPELRGMPIFAAGVEMLEPGQGSPTLYLDYLTWEGTPCTIFTRPTGGSPSFHTRGVWRQAWVNAVDQWEKRYPEAFRLVQNRGRGMIATGTREWTDYRVTADIRPALLSLGGLAARVQGLQRFYTLALTGDHKIRLLKIYEGQETVLAEAPCEWQPWQTYRLSLEVHDSHLRGWLDGRLVADVEDREIPLASGAIGLVVKEGHLMTDQVNVEALAS